MNTTQENLLRGPTTGRDWGGWYIRATRPATPFFRVGIKSWEPARGKPFYVGFVAMGIDTRNFEGFAQDDKGNLYHLWYWQTIPVKDSGHASISNCPMPVNLRIANGVHLSCDKD